MKTGKDFREAFPQMDEGFYNAVLQGLANTEKEREPMKKKISVGAVLIAAMVMMAAAGVAAVVGNWGLMDFLQGKSLLQAQEMITRVEGVTAETSQATFAVQEALYDGYGVYLTINIRAKEPDTLPLPGGCTVQDKASRLNLDKEGTIADYAAKKGWTRFVSVGVAQDFVGEGEHFAGFSATRCNLEEDGSLTMMLSGLRAGEGIGAEAADLTLLCGADSKDLTDTDEWAYREDVERADMIIQLSRRDEVMAQAASAEPVTLAEMGVTIHSVQLVQTPLAVYYEVDFTCGPETKRPPMFGLDGKMRSEVAQISAYTRTDKAAGRWLMRATLSAMEELPEAIDLTIMEGGTNQQYTITIPITKQ